MSNPEESAVSLETLLAKQAVARPESLAVWQDGQRVTYQQLYDRVGKVAAALGERGIRPGTSVALFFQNTVDCVVAFLALARLRACLIPLEPAMSHERLVEMRREAGFLWFVGYAATLQPYSALFADAHTFALDADLYQSQPRVQAPTLPQPNEIFIYHYTSGSMGLPKAAMHTQENLINGGRIYEQTFHIESTDRILAAIPLLHSFGMVAGVVTALVTGAALILLEQFVPRRLLQLLTEARATILLAVPLMYELVGPGQFNDVDLSTLRLSLSSGGPLPREVSERFQRHFGKSIYQVYGCSEAGIISAQTPEDEGNIEHSAGKPVGGVEMRLLTEAREILSVGEIGMLEVRTPAMFYGYLKNPVATQAVLHNGWYWTGDLARQDENGYLYLCGRKETFINVGGKKVNPLVVEQVLCSHPLVQEALVWGRVTGRATEGVQAAVVLQSPISVVELKSFCRAHLQAYEVPIEIDCVASLPRTALGKKQRFSSGLSLPNTQQDTRAQ